MLAQRSFRRPSPAIVVAVIALVVALGGTSFAALALKRNSVSSLHIKNGQVKGVDLARNSVSTSKVANGRLLAADFARGQLPAGPRGAPGPPGPQGLTGEPGPQGSRGPEGLSDAFVASFEPVQIPTVAGPPVSLADIDLPAGSFIVLANAIVANGTDGVKGIHCGLGAPGISQSGQSDSAVDIAEVDVGESPFGTRRATLSLTGAIVLDQPAKLSFDCFLSGLISTGNLFVSDIEIGALEVQLHVP
jgi:hypothetical protein